jgi:hypothetical protein
MTQLQISIYGPENRMEINIMRREDSTTDEARLAHEIQTLVNHLLKKSADAADVDLAVEFVAPLFGKSA